MDREVVTELIQDKFTKKNLQIELDKILANTSRTTLLTDYEKLEKKLGGPGASAKVASLIYTRNQ